MSWISFSATSFPPKYQPKRAIRHKYPIAHNRIIGVFAVPMLRLKAYRNRMVNNNALMENCPNLNVKNFMAYKFKRLIIESFVNIRIFLSTKRLKSLFPFSVR